MKTIIAVILAVIIALVLMKVTKKIVKTAFFIALVGVTFLVIKYLVN